MQAAETENEYSIIQEEESMNKKKMFFLVSGVIFTLLLVG